MMAARSRAVAIISYFFISNINRMEIKYINNRDIQQGNNFFSNFRPSAFIRILKFPLQYSIFQTALTYGIIYNGFGLHSYFLQKTGSTMGFAPWARSKTIATTFSKYLAIALPFFYLKEVFVSLLYISTRDKPQLRKTLDFSLLHNAFAFAATFPVFYYFQRNLKKSLRGCLVLTLFSITNDVFIESRRKEFLLNGANYQQILTKRVEGNLVYVKSLLQSQMIAPAYKQRIANINWQRLRDDVLTNRTAQNNSEQVRAQQMNHIANQMRQSFKSLKQVFG